jgi:hypothetical protein
MPERQTGNALAGKDAKEAGEKAKTNVGSNKTTSDDECSPARTLRSVVTINQCAFRSAAQQHRPGQCADFLRHAYATGRGRLILPRPVFLSGLAVTCLCRLQVGRGRVSVGAFVLLLTVDAAFRGRSRAQSIKSDFIFAIDANTVTAFVHSLARQFDIT